jgi:hypothetical protein
MTVRIHIDRLVLEGFDYSPHEVALLESALGSELSRRLETGGISQELLGGGSVDAVNVSNISLPQKPSAGQSGRAIARAIHGGISK